MLIKTVFIFLLITTSNFSIYDRKFKRWNYTRYRRNGLKITTHSQYRKTENSTNDNLVRGNQIFGHPHHSDDWIIINKVIKTSSSKSSPTKFSSTKFIFQPSISPYVSEIIIDSRSYTLLNSKTKLVDIKPQLSLSGQSSIFASSSNTKKTIPLRISYTNLLSQNSYSWVSSEHLFHNFSTSLTAPSSSITTQTIQPPSSLEYYCSMSLVVPLQTNVESRIFQLEWRQNMEFLFMSTKRRRKRSTGKVNIFIYDVKRGFNPPETVNIQFFIQFEDDFVLATNVENVYRGVDDALMNHVLGYEIIFKPRALLSKQVHIKLNVLYWVIIFVTVAPVVCVVLFINFYFIRKVCPYDLFTKETTIIKNKSHHQPKNKIKEEVN